MAKNTRKASARSTNVKDDYSKESRQIFEDVKGFYARNGRGRENLNDDDTKFEFISSAVRSFFRITSPKDRRVSSSFTCNLCYRPQGDRWIEDVEMIKYFLSKNIISSEPRTVTDEEHIEFLKVVEDRIKSVRLEANNILAAHTNQGVDEAPKETFERMLHRLVHNRLRKPYSDHPRHLIDIHITLYQTITIVVTVVVPEWKNYDIACLYIQIENVNDEIAVTTLESRILSSKTVGGEPYSYHAKQVIERFSGAQLINEIKTECAKHCGIKYSSYRDEKKYKFKYWYMYQTLQIECHTVERINAKSYFMKN